MKDYSYFIPGYTGFCPEMREHFGQTYGRATRHIMRGKPHLKDRLAPVFYNYRLSKLTRNIHEKDCDEEKEKHDLPKVKQRVIILDPGKAKYHTDFDGGDTGRERHHADDRKDISRWKKRSTFHEEEHISKGKYCTRYDDGDRLRIKNIHEKICGEEKEKHDLPKVKQRVIILDPGKAKYHTDFDGGDKCRERHHTDDGKDISSRKKRSMFHEEEHKSKGKYYTRYNDGDRMRKVDYQCLCPRYIYIESYAEVVPECWKIRDASDSYYSHYPHVTRPCVNLKEHSQEATQQRKDSSMFRVPRVKPHRYGGVIPKYTGHIPGLQFSFGESYGPATDRLLRRHHDVMVHRTRKS